MRTATASNPILAPIASLIANRSLIFRLIARELQARYRGSALGLLWSVITPLMMVGVYTLVFTYIFSPRWEVPPGVETNFILLLYSGVLVFGIFSECINRAPTIILENVSYVKKVVFPLAILPIVAMGVALVNFAIGLVVLEVIRMVQFGPPPLTTIALPFVIAPLILVTLGISWLLAGLGVYSRDLQHFVASLVTLLMFLSPIFYPASAIPKSLQWLMSLNPLTPILEATKQVMFWGEWPQLQPLIMAYIASALFAAAGYLVFTNLRRGFADVV
jgi:lipopolysaccharide transport system permease protein